MPWLNGTNLSKYSLSACWGGLRMVAENGRKLMSLVTDESQRGADWYLPNQNEPDVLGKSED